MIGDERTARELRVVWNVLGSVGGAPWVLAYAAVAAVGIVGLIGLMTVGLYPLAAVHEGLVFVAFLGVPFLGIPLLWGTIATAYCYEIDQVLSGRRPVPLSGLLVAGRRFHRVAFVSLALAVAGFLSTGTKRSVGDGWLNLAFGETERFSLTVLVAFAYPVLATTDGSFRDGLRRFHEIVEAGWGTLTLTTLGLRKARSLLIKTFLLPGVLLGVAHALLLYASVFEVVPEATQYGLSVGPLGLATLPLGLIALGFGSGMVFTFSVEYLLNTLVFRYVLDDELPDGVAIDAADVEVFGVQRLDEEARSERPNLAERAD